MNRFFTTALVNKRTALGEKEKGFTLIELLVVVLILGVLAAIAIPIYLGQQDTAKDNAVAAAITNAKTAVVAELVTGNSTLSEIGDGFPTSLTAYTPSDDIAIGLVVAGDTFVITGSWAPEEADATPVLTEEAHAHTITEKSAADGYKTPVKK